MKHIEIKTIETKGIKIGVKINYDKGEVSLVERNGCFRASDWKDKHFIFAGRGLEYMNGWLVVLEAMQVAIKEAKKDLEHDLAEKSKFEKDTMVKVINGLAKMKI